MRAARLDVRLMRVEMLTLTLTHTLATVVVHVSSSTYGSGRCREPVLWCHSASSLPDMGVRALRGLIRGLAEQPEA